MNFLRRLALCASYVTCLPVYKLQLESSDEVLAGLSKYLPSVGLIIGFCLVLAAKVLALIHAPHLVQGAVLTVLWFVFTSGLHLDGLMDTADGIFSHQQPSRMLEIMQDPRVGNFGVIIGVLLMLTKFAALASLFGGALLVPLLVIPAWARFSEVYAIGKFPYLREYGKGKIWHDTTDFPRDLFLSAILPVIATVAAAFTMKSAYPIAVAFAAIAGGVFCTNWLNRKLGGQTGDTYGATVEISEAVGLIFASIAVQYFSWC